jgi:hypothetical protein
MVGPLVNLSKVCYEPVEVAAILPRYLVPHQVKDSRETEQRLRLILGANSREYVNE